MNEEPGFVCKAHNICLNMGNDRGACRTLPNIGIGEVSLEQRVENISYQLANMQACLASIVLLLSQANQKET